VKKSKLHKTSKTIETDLPVKKSERKVKRNRHTVSVSVSQEAFEALYKRAFDLDRTQSWVAEQLFLKLKNKEFVL
jgi:ribosomal protein S10